MSTDVVSALLRAPGIQPVDWLATAPVLVPAVAALVLLALDAILGTHRAPRAAPRRAADLLALAGLLGALALLVPLAGADRETFCTASGRCSYVVSPLTLVLQVLVLGAALVCLLLAQGQRDRLPRTELQVLLLTATAGACALAGARDYATLAVALETVSLPAVGLVALQRDSRAAEAGLKLLMTSVLSFSLLALGVALIYASTGSLYLGASPSSALGDLRAVQGVGLALVVAGAAFKVSLVPFHLWTPETYAGASVPVAAFLATVSKVAGVSAIVLVLALGAPARAAGWAAPVGVLAVLTMSVGNLLALRQRTAVRLLAWSTVAQAGWVLLPLAGSADGQVAAAVSASLGYLLAYVAASLTAFAAVVWVGERHPDGARHGLDAYTGLWRRQPALTLVLGFALFALAGLPPGLLGVVAKVVAIVPVVAVQGWGLVAVAVVNVVLGVAVYLRWAARLVARNEPASLPAAPGASLAVTPGASLVVTPGASLAVTPGAPASRAGRTPLAHRLALALAGGACLALSVLPQAIAGALGLPTLR